MSLPGKLLYRFWYQPVGKIADVVAAGGPLEMYRTKRGQTEMETAARTLPLLPEFPDRPLHVHLLTGNRFWYQTAFCMWSFAQRARRTIAPTLYDDGTLLTEQWITVKKLFPLAELVSREKSLAKLNQFLPVSKFPTLRERWINYPNIRKLIDPHIGGTGWQLVLDSDLLFFRSPGFLIDWLEQPDRPLHAVDCKTCYGYSQQLMEQLAGKSIPDLINVGLTGLESSSINWGRMEAWCRDLIERERTSYYLEQALIAMLLAGQDCAIAPAADYVTHPVPPEVHECRAVMHHYVANTKRHYFQRNWRMVLKQ